MEMRCHPPKGRPAPAISWLQNDRPIDPTSDKNFIVTGEGHLIVVAARLSDTNNYTCVAENVASKRFSDPATITVYGKPNFCFLKRISFDHRITKKFDDLKNKSGQNCRLG